MGRWLDDLLPISFAVHPQFQIKGMPKNIPLLWPTFFLTVYIVLLYSKCSTWVVIGTKCLPGGL